MLRFLVFCFVLATVSAHGESHLRRLADPAEPEAVETEPTEVEATEDSAVENTTELNEEPAESATEESENKEEEETTEANSDAKAEDVEETQVDQPEEPAKQEIVDPVTEDEAASEKDTNQEAEETVPEAEENVPESNEDESAEPKQTDEDESDDSDASAGDGWLNKQFLDEMRSKLGVDDGMVITYKILELLPLKDPTILNEWKNALVEHLQTFSKKNYPDSTVTLRNADVLGQRDENEDFLAVEKAASKSEASTDAEVSKEADGVIDVGMQEIAQEQVETERRLEAVSVAEVVVEMECNSKWYDLWGCAALCAELSDESFASELLEEREDLKTMGVKANASCPDTTHATVAFILGLSVLMLVFCLPLIVCCCCRKRKSRKHKHKHYYPGNSSSDSDYESSSSGSSSSSDSD